MIRDVTYFLTQEYRDRGGRGFDVDTVPFEFLDAFGNEFVVVYERPQVSNVFVVQREKIRK